MRNTLVLAATLACVAAPAVSEESIRPQPADWLFRPGITEFRAAYPAEAAQDNTSGKALVNCRVSSDGSLRDCAAVSEEPTGRGFGAAAVSIVAQARLKPAFVKKHADAMISLPANFSPGMLYDRPITWINRPSAQQYNAAWPQKAFTQGIDGAATIACRINFAGALEQCKVRSESPAGMAFGESALLLAPAFRFKPVTRDGKPVLAPVTIPINFKTGPGAARTSAVAPQAVEDARILNAPPFDKAPTYADIIAAWPGGSSNAAEGNAAMRCRLHETGLLDDCSFSYVSAPKFERPSRELAKKFHVKVGSATREQLKDVFVSVPIQFVNPSRAPSARTVTNARWTVTPDEDASAAFYPAEAARQGVKVGRGQAQCLVSETGTLVDCKPVSGTPEKLGFDVAAAHIAATMQIALWGEDGLPTAGATVVLPIRINQPQPAAAVQ